MWTVANIRTFAKGIYSKPTRPIFPADVVYIARGGHGLASGILHNPFVPLDSPTKYAHAWRVPDPIRAYRWMLGNECKAYSGCLIAQEIHRLAAMGDGTLLCFCAPSPCHGAAVVAAIEWQRRTQTIPMVEQTVAAVKDFYYGWHLRCERIAQVLRAAEGDAHVQYRS